MGETITYYRLVVKDVTSGRRKAMEGRDPIRGRYEAEAERERLQRASRDPNQRYELEKTAAPGANDPGNDSGIFEHNFRDRRW